MLFTRDMMIQELQKLQTNKKLPDISAMNNPFRAASETILNFYDRLVENYGGGTVVKFFITEANVHDFFFNQTAEFKNALMEISIDGQIIYFNIYTDGFNYRASKIKIKRIKNKKTDVIDELLILVKESNEKVILSLSSNYLDNISSFSFCIPDDCIYGLILNIHNEPPTVDNKIITYLKDNTIYGHIDYVSKQYFVTEEPWVNEKLFNRLLFGSCIIICAAIIFCIIYTLSA